MGKPLPPWTKINKGERRPTMRVLVAYEYVDFLHGQKGWGVTGAYWSTRHQHWIADHGKPITGVTHWMPLPDAPSQN